MTSGQAGGRRSTLQVLPVARPHAGCRPEALPHRVKSRQTAYLLGSSSGRPPVASPVLRVAGISGYRWLRAAIPVRDVSGTSRRPAVGRASADNRRRRFAGSLRRIDGSDGTRTRDLRRDRPARRNRLQPATTRNYRLEQAIPHRANLDRLRPAATRQGLCSTCVVDSLAGEATGQSGRPRTADAIASRLEGSVAMPTVRATRRTSSRPPRSASGSAGHVRLRS
jgi:hypothetical protein